MFYMQTRIILAVSIVLSIVGYLLFTMTGLSSLLQNNLGIGFVFGVLSFTTLLLIFGRNQASADQQGNEHDDEPGEQNSQASGDLATLYVGNLSYKVNERDVKAHFEQYGFVNSVRLMKDKRTGKRKGFGFVEVDTGNQDAMIEALNDTSFHERTLKVRTAKDKVEK